MIRKYLSLDMLCHGAGKHDFLQILTFQHQTLRRILMGYASHILVDNRTGIEFCRNIMACRSDYFHAALPCLMIRFRANESRKERVMDINNVVGIFGNHLIGNDLHIPRKHYKRDVVLFQKLHLRLFHLGLV